MDRLSSAGLLASRVLLSGIFLFSGAGKIANFSATQGYMAAAGMKMTGMFLVLAILIELGGGLSLLLGYFPRVGALALLLLLFSAYYQVNADEVGVVQQGGWPVVDVLGVPDPCELHGDAGGALDCTGIGRGRPPTPASGNGCGRWRRWPA